MGAWIRASGTPAGAAQTSAAPPCSADSYVFTPTLDLRALRDFACQPVKGIHVVSSAAGSSTSLAKLLALADQTEINAFVIDIKDESGHVTYAADVPLAHKLGLIQARIKEIDGLVSTLVKHKIVPIALGQASRGSRGRCAARARALPISRSRRAARPPVRACCRPLPRPARPSCVGCVPCDRRSAAARYPARCRLGWRAGSYVLLITPALCCSRGKSSPTLSASGASSIQVLLRYQ